MNWMKMCVNLFVYIMFEFDCILYVMLYVVWSVVLDVRHILQLRLLLS